MALTRQKAEGMMSLTGKHKGRENEGFLLLEIMMSVSILACGVLFVLNSFIRPIRAMELSIDYFKAGFLLEEKMLELYNSSVEDGAMRGEFSSFDNRFSWALDIGDIEGGFCKEINLKVTWHNKDKEEDLSISTYI